MEYEQQRDETDETETEIDHFAQYCRKGKHFTRKGNFGNQRKMRHKRFGRGRQSNGEEVEDEQSEIREYRERDTDLVALLEYYTEN